MVVVHGREDRLQVLVLADNRMDLDHDHDRDQMLKNVLNQSQLDHLQRKKILWIY